MRLKRLVGALVALVVLSALVPGVPVSSAAENPSGRVLMLYGATTGNMSLEGIDPESGARTFAAPLFALTATEPTYAFDPVEHVYYLGAYDAELGDRWVTVETRTLLVTNDEWTAPGISLLRYDTVTDRIYGIRDSVPPYGFWALAALEPATGEFIEDVCSLGGLGITGYSAQAYGLDPVTRTFFFTATTGSGDRYVTLDIDTCGLLEDAPRAGTFRGMVYDEPTGQRRAYGVSDTGSDQVARVDLSTGTVTTLGSTTHPVRATEHQVAFDPLGDILYYLTDDGAATFLRGYNVTAATSVSPVSVTGPVIGFEWEPAITPDRASDELQDDPGTGGGDASDVKEYPTFLDLTDPDLNLEGTLQPRLDLVDAYEFIHADAGGDLAVVVDPKPGFDVNVTLYRSTNLDLPISFSDDGGFGHAEVVSKDNAPAGRYTVVIQFVATTGSLELPLDPTGPSGTTTVGLGGPVKTYRIDPGCRPEC